jgi:hypothetical protein|tara:strand:+ start:529 stop:951 length:423 start_codon:yes stop_codon:yes gene_type:complete
MKLYIQMSDGQPHEHPIIDWNFKQAFPDIDVDNLPPEYCSFVRVQAPILGPYERNQTVSYGLAEGLSETYTDIWVCEDMTAEEITAKQDAVKAGWAENDGFASWVFNEATCAYEAPTPRPASSENQVHIWNEETLSWMEL